MLFCGRDEGINAFFALVSAEVHGCLLENRRGSVDITDRLQMSESVTQSVNGGGLPRELGRAVLGWNECNRVEENRRRARQSLIRRNLLSLREGHAANLWSNDRQRRPSAGA
jgi:hypothetical protein